jgi:diguanylate cyclase (GGDEF)-like protein
MSTPLLSGQHNFIPFQKQGNVLSLVENKDEIQSRHDSSRLLHLTNQLQSSLEVEDVLSRFSDQIKEYLPHHGLRYQRSGGNHEFSFDFSIGKSARHRLKYELSINNEKFGMLEISRKSKFNEREIVDAEQLVRTLLYPLRNAVLYQMAVSAAHKDALTSVGNRAAFDEALSRQVEIAHRHDRTLGMIVIDIDHFKKINDTYGHAAGDCLLQTLAKTASSTIRLSDQIFRYGGEEFVILLPESSLAGVKRLADRIRRNVEAVEWMCNGQPITMTASFGIAILKDDETESGFFVRADKALYQAKADGRNCTRVAD